MESYSMFSRSASFNQHNILEIYPHYCVYEIHHFLLLNGIPLCQYSTFVYLLNNKRDEAISTLGLLWVKLLWAFMHKSCMDMLWSSGIPVSRCWDRVRNAKTTQRQNPWNTKLWVDQKIAEDCNADLELAKEKGNRAKLGRKSLQLKYRPDSVSANPIVSAGAKISCEREESCSVSSGVSEKQVPR